MCTKSSIYRFVVVFLSGFFLLAATSPAWSGNPGVPEEKTGRASIVIYDDIESGYSETRYFLIEQASKHEIRLHFKGEPPAGFKTGKKYKVKGKKHSGGLDVDSIEALDEGGDPGQGESASSPLAAAETRKILTLLVDFTDATVDGPGMNYGVDPQEASDIMYNNTKSVAGLYRNASLNTLTLDPDSDGDGVQDVFGPYQIDYTYLKGNGGGCWPSTWVAAASAAWEDANPNKDISIYFAAQAPG